MMKMTNFDDHTQQICFSRSTVYVLQAKEGGHSLGLYDSKDKESIFVIIFKP